MFDTFKKLLKYIRPYIWFSIIALILAIISVASMLYIPIVIGKCVDLIVKINDVDFDGLLKYMIIIISVAGIYGICQWLLLVCMHYISNSITKDLRLDVFIKINRMPLKYIDVHSKGDMLARTVTDIENVATGLLQGLIQLFTGIVTIIGTLIFMFTISIALALLVIVLTPLSLFMAAFIAKKIHSMYKQYSKTNGELTGIIDEYISNQKIVKTLNYEENALGKFKDKNEILYKNGVKAQIFSSYINPTTRFVNSIVYACVGVLGALLVIYYKNNDVNHFFARTIFTVGTLTSFLSYSTQYTKPFNEISSVINELQTASASLKRVMDLIEEENIIDNGQMSIHSEGNVNVNNVYFSYQSNKKFIEDLNITAYSGEKIAIVGPTGCGKTTIINLLMRFYEIDSGVIALDNVNIIDLPLSELRKNYGMVLQDTWLFKGTIRDNIAYGRIDASFEDIIVAAKHAHCHNFIMRLEKGYDTIISNNDGLSEGQKQLISIARVMVSLPTILILDEATSSIDTLTEIKVQAALQDLMKNHTTFIIAHRLSTIKSSDKILVMKDGKIIECDNHENLLMKKGFYYNLYNSQFQE